MTGYDGYLLYLGLKLHFSPGTYDYFKYCGHVKSNPEKFDLRNDRYFFHKLVRKYTTKDELLFFLASNFFSRKVVWVRDLLMEEAHEIYLKKLKVKESLEYTVKEDLEAVFAGESTINNFKLALKVSGGGHPLLLTAALQGNVNWETVVVLDAVIGFLPVWEQKITDTILFPDFKHKCLRYAPFLGIDVKKFQNLLKSQLTS